MDFESTRLLHNSLYPSPSLFFISPTNCLMNEVESALVYYILRIGKGGRDIYKYHHCSNSCFIWAPVLSLHIQLEYPSFGELETYQWGKMYGGGGYILISYYLCAIEMLSLYTIELLSICFVR